MNEAWLLPGLLLAVLASPLVFALVLLRVSRRGHEAARNAAAWLAGLHFVITAVLVVLAAASLSNAPTGFAPFEPVGVPGDPGLGLNEPTGTTTWSLLPIATGSLSKTSIQLFFGLDGLNLPLIALTSLMTFLAVLVSWPTVTSRSGAFYGWLFLLQACCLGAFLSFDLLLFYICFELTLIPAFFLIGSHGTGGGRRDAARKFFLYTLFGSLFTLVGILGIAITNPTPMHNGARVIDGTKVMPTAGAITFSIPELMRNVKVWDDAHDAAVSRTKGDTAAVEAQKDRRRLACWLFVALLAGFAVKVPIVPFHTWLPNAYAEAPLAITLFLSAVMAKLGTFGILRIVLPLVPEPAVQYGLTWVGTLGAIGIIYAALCAYGQKDLRLLAAYSSVSHLGFLVLALFALTPESLSGATLHMVNHGLTAGAMFALLAFLAERYKTLDMNQYGGLMARLPHYAFFMMVICLASVGLPGLCNFVSEMLMLAGLFDPRNLGRAGFGLAACAAAGIFLSAWYTFTMVKKVFFGPVKEPLTLTEVKDVTPREHFAFTILVAFCLALGLYPQPVLDVIRPDVQRVVNAAEAARTRLNPSQKGPGTLREKSSPQSNH